MSELRTGRGCVAHMDQAERTIKRNWWMRYARSLAPQERRAMRAGSYNAFTRPYQPEFAPGDWLEVGPNHEVRVAEIQPKPGGYRIIIDRVQDFRGEPITHSRLREALDPAVVTTLDIGSDHPVTQPEPPKVPHSIVKDLPSTQQALERYERTQAARRREEDALPLAERLRRLEASGSPQARRQLRAIRALVAEGERRAGLRRAS